MKHLVLALAALALASCATPPAPPQAEASAPTTFFAQLSLLCGQSFRGRVVTHDAADAGIASEHLVMHVRECSATEIRVPFHVGENRSRTWVITRTGSGLRLKHDHRHEDGSEDTLTQYGGDSAGAGTQTRQDFPADAFSQRLFHANNIPASAENVWSVEIQPGHLFAYQLERPSRYFRVEFDLSAPVETPPPPWGS
ncbi:hypothetical protein U91I_02009 [alpha proteobacterium U9-1i]|nr:hypothetical protein U91I_02009 [alpha proteobacterium U9-1i]